MRVGFVKGAFYYCYFVVERLPILFFSLMQKLRKGGKQNIWIIIQAIRLHKRFHSPLHQVLTVKTAISVFAVIKHPEQSICVCVCVCHKIIKSHFSICQKLEKVNMIFFKKKLKCQFTPQRKLLRKLFSAAQWSKKNEMYLVLKFFFKQQLIPKKRMY